MIDLRLNKDNGSDEGFWPSFTDIMTVIVMIFLIAMVVLLIRNMELVKKLRSTMEAERETARISQLTSAANDTLENQLTTAESELSMARMKILQLHEQLKNKNNTLVSQREQLGQLMVNNQDLVNKVDVLKYQKQNLQNKNDEILNNLNIKSLRLSKLETAFKSMEATLKTVRSDFETQSKQLEYSQEALKETNALLEQSQDDLSQLNVKYNKLIKPARSPRGKYIVEVRFYKKDGIRNVDYKTASMKQFKAIKDKALHQKLAALKKKHPNNIYIKIVFPKSSGLSYNEAWTFTNELLNRYDYYHQKTGGSEK